MSNIKTKITVELGNQILKYFKNHTVSSTLRKFNLGRTVLTNFLKANNVPLHSSSKAEVLKHLEQDGYDLFSTSFIQEVLSSYSELKCINLVAEKYSLKKYFIEYLCSENNLPVQYIKKEHVYVPPKISTRKFNTKKEQEAIISFYLTPHTVVDTAAKFNTSTDVIRRILNENNIQRHDAHIVGYIGQQKARETNLEKYGVANVFQSEIIKDRASKTKFERYGNEKYLNREQAKETFVTRYGADSFLKSNEGQAAIRKFNQKRYGVDYAFQSTDWQNDSKIRQKAEKTRFENKYTTSNFSELYLNLQNDLIKLSTFVDGKTLFEIADALSITRDHAYYLLSKNNLLDKVAIRSSESRGEQEVLNFIGPDICVQHDRKILEGREIDILIPSKNIGIEFDGTYWHSTAAKTDRNYHINKSKLAEQKGIRLIHIYEYEWVDPEKQEKIKMLLDAALGRKQIRIYARKCLVRPVTNKEVAALSNTTHLQGHRSAQVTYGLFYNDELVQFMSFSKTRYNKNLTTDNSWEIIRSCSKNHYQIVGGASKLFTAFVQEHEPDFVFSYCDFNKFDGKSYKAIGMEFVGYTGPDMKWLLPGHLVVNRNPSKHKELKERAEAQIFGAGSKKYLWSKNTL